MEEKQYLDYLTNQDIFDLIDKFDSIIVDKNGNEIQPDDNAYERQYDEDEKNYVLCIRCKSRKGKSEQAAEELIFNHPTLNMLNRISQMFESKFQTDIDLLYISDFLVKEISASDFFNKTSGEKVNKQEVFANFMRDKLSAVSTELGKKYVKDYNNFIKKFNREVRQKRKNNFGNDREM